MNTATPETKFTCENTDCPKLFETFEGRTDCPECGNQNPPIINPDLDHSTEGFPEPTTAPLVDFIDNGEPEEAVEKLATWVEYKGDLPDGDISVDDVNCADPDIEGSREPAAPARSAEDEVAELLKNAGLKREDIENWADGSPVEAMPKAGAGTPKQAILEEPNPKLVEYIDNIRASGELPEYPVEFITKAIQGSLTKREVDAIVGEIRMNVSLGEIAEKAFSIVVTDASQKDKMKEARELRLLVRQERLRIDHNAMAVKEPYLRKCQVIDPVRKHITDQFKAVETHLKDQEDFIKRQEAKLAEERRVARWEELASLEFQGLAELHGLGEMTDAAYEAIRSSAKTAYDLKKADEARLENERILREEKAQRLAGRQNTLSALGLIYGMAGYAFGDIVFPRQILEEGTDEEFQAEIARLTPAIDYAKGVEANKRAMQDREASRKNEVRRLGMSINADFDYQYSTEHGTAVVSHERIDNATDEEWTVLVGSTTQAIAEIDDKATRFNNRIGKLQQIGLSYLEDQDAYVYPDLANEINVDMTAVRTLPADEFKAMVQTISDKIIVHQAEQREMRIRADEAIGITGTDKEKLERLANQFEMIILPNVDNATAKLILEKVEQFRTGIVTVLRQGADKVI